ncbi:DUF4129 domain-containing transglutaminase family protein [Lentibacillus saliphilus]|uniref:DUF4129 domain-containing transglutaminase family protein n=1 Tax=Lentibacillus saliphilus TaxID=2737028 RepID=UPI001C2F56ED|nr:transglutaminase domain-containing protein [Lentibacillus saliphilus]
MSRLKQTDETRLYSFLLYACGLLLFLEWIYPVKEIAPPFNLNVFILYTIFCFLISFLRLNWLLAFGLKAFGLVLLVDSLYLEATLLSRPWFSEVMTEIWYNIDMVQAAQWIDLTAMFRTTLLLLLIWLMSYLLYYWFVTANRMLLFVVLTIVYIGVLDTFTTYDGMLSIVRTFVIAFFALGFSNFLKVIQREAIALPKRMYAWQAPIIIAVLASTTIGYALPKFAPQWPDPVPFIQSYADNAGSGGSGSGTTVRKIGYGEDDTRLGGSFVQDEKVIFKGASKERGYWRVDSKGIYTGKGWESFSNLGYVDAGMGSVSLNMFNKARVETEEQPVTVSFAPGKGIGKLPYQYGAKVFSFEPDANATISFVRETGSVYATNNDVAVDRPEYLIDIDRPFFNEDELRRAPEDDPADIERRYTQLPATLPERVYTLAEELTANVDNRYDKAKTIEQYFGRSGYTYQISDVPVPKEDEDYVDQFLFDSKVGYCDNYSTTMAVMLRTLGIPTRWVKGFTPGEKVDDTELDGHKLNIYEVKSSNSHSWVEVYFPDYGWVPFEPTQGFSNPTEFTDDTALGDEQDDEPLETPEPDEQDTPEMDMPDEQQPELDEGGAAAGSDDEATGTFNWWLLGGVIAFLVVLSLIVYKLRWQWRTVYFGVMMQRKASLPLFQKAYHHLLHVLDHKGLTKMPDQTLREYAARIDQRFDTHLMGDFTAYYEHMIYSREEQEDTRQLTESWKLLMKRILS